MFVIILRLLTSSALSTPDMNSISQLTTFLHSHNTCYIYLCNMLLKVILLNLEVSLLKNSVGRIFACLFVLSLFCFLVCCLFAFSHSLLTSCFLFIISWMVHKAVGSPMFFLRKITWNFSLWASGKKKIKKILCIYYLLDIDQWRTKTSISLSTDHVEILIHYSKILHKRNKINTSRSCWVY